MRPRWLGLLLVAWSVAFSPSRADIIIVDPPLDGQAGDRVSHKSIGNGLEADLSPEQRLARRLGGPRTQKGAQDSIQFNKDMQELARKFLNDPELLKSLANNLKPEDIARLRGSIGDGKAFANDPAWRDIFEKGMKGLAGQQLTDNDRKLLEQWKDRFGKVGPGTSTPTPITPPDGQNPQPPVPPTPPPGQPGAQPPSVTPQPPGNWDRLPEGTTDWMKNNLDRFAQDWSKWLETPSGQNARNLFRDIAPRAETQAAAPPLGERMRGIGRYLPRPGQWMINRVTPRVSPRLFTLPRLPSGTTMPRVSASEAGQTVLAVAVVGLLLFFVWRSRNWWQGVIAARLPASWRLGPWPVRPQQVTTRADLVRAFEYLALLSLGPVARTYHHLDLGRLIGHQAALDPDRRRDAADTLARLYEQARYTPDDEPLSPEQMAIARHELGYLAGELAA